MDLVAGALLVPLNDRLERGKERAQQFIIPRGFVIGTDRVDIPERGIDRVVFRRLALVREGLFVPLWRDTSRKISSSTTYVDRRAS